MTTIAKLATRLSRLSDRLAALEVMLLGDALPPSEKRALRSSLLAYCERDTLAMVSLDEPLLDLAGMGP